MPASSAESCDPIEQLLQSSLEDRRCDASTSNNAHFEQQLLNSAKKVLLSKVEFQPAENEYTLALNNNLKAKYIHLNPDGGGSNVAKKTNNSDGGNNGRCSVSPQLDDDGIPMPKVVIHPPEKVTLGWQRIYRIGAGLANLGNTCFLNAILQCLTYTPPLVNHLIEFDEHVTNCKNVGFCMMCELYRHIRRALEKNGETIKPQCILQKLKAIAKHMVWGRQEDAHEFLRYVMESMIKSSLKGYTPTSLDRISLETTVVNHIFGGYHRSQVICLRCKEKSDTYDHFMDIILDIKNVPSLEKAMEKFVQAEILDNENAYLCPRCKRKCPAQKKFSVHRTPNIVTFQFKRFDYNRMVGGKITKQIAFPEKFNMRPYMSQRNGPPVMFQLYAVLVHQGVSCNSGHYFCFVRNSNNLWYIMDDCKVRQVSLNFVLSQQAYLLFYTRVHNNSSASFSKQNSETQISLLNSGPSMNGTLSHMPFDSSSSLPSKKTNINGTTPVKLKPTVSTLVNSMNVVKTSTSNNLLPLPNVRDRVSFGMKTHTVQQPFAQMNGPKNGKQPNGDVDQKHPRIVMHIKHGKVTSTEQPWSLSQDNSVMRNDVSSNNEQPTCVKNLVPYIPDSSEESDQENRCKSRSSPSKNSIVSGDTSSTRPEPRTPSSTSAKRCSRESSPGNIVSHNVRSTPTEITTQCSDRAKPLAVATSGVKAKATSSWLVMETSQQSPSMASEGSSTSVNSTTGWTVTENNGMSKMDRPCPGWTITDHEKNNKVKSGKLPKRIRYCNDDSDLHNHVDKSCVKGKVYHSDTETHKPLRKRKFVPFSTVEDFRRTKTKCQSNVVPSKPGPDVKETSRVEVNGSGDAPTCRSETCSDNVPPSSEQNPDVRKNDKIDNEAKSDSEVVNGNQTESLSRKHRKHKKHRREKQYTDDERRSVDADSGTSDGSPCRSKKRKKKHKRHHDSLERHRDRHQSDSSSGYELEWVERTKESLEKEKNELNAAAVKYWDEDVKDGYKLNQPTSSSNSTTNRNVCWDGRRSSNAASELANHTIHGYGDRVSTWDGDNSQVDRREIGSFKNHCTRRYSDEYNKDYDRGRVKKKKNHKQQHYFDSGAGYNPFQWAQEKHCFQSRFQERPYSKFTPKTYRHGNGSYYNNGVNNRYEQFKYQYKL